MELWKGAEGGVLLAVNAGDGSMLSEIKLSVVPRFDSLITAHKNLYYTTLDGALVCLKGE